MASDFGCVVYECCGTNMDGLHGQPLLTVFFHGRGLSAGSGIVNLLQDSHFFIVQFFTGFSIECNSVSLGIWHHGPVVSVSVYLSSPVSGNALSFCSHCRNLLIVFASLLSLFYQNSGISANVRLTVISGFAHFAVYLFAQWVSPGGYILRCIPAGWHL